MSNIVEAAHSRYMYLRLPAKTLLDRFLQSLGLRMLITDYFNILSNNYLYLLYNAFRVLRGCQCYYGLFSTGPYHKIHLNVVIRI